MLKILRAVWVWRVLFAILLGVVMTFALMPDDGEPGPPHVDKLQHIMGFVILTISGLLAFPRSDKVMLALGLLAYGGLIEVLQSFTETRHAEWADLGADALGILLAYGLMLWGGRRQGSDQLDQLP